MFVNPKPGQTPTAPTGVSSGRRDRVRDRATYEKTRAKVRERHAEIRLAKQEIGDLPDVVHPRKKKRAERDFRYFCETYFPAEFVLKWSPDHLRVLAKVEQVVKRGEVLAVAMPRGSGKTTICQKAVLWAILGGHHRFAMLVGATGPDAIASLANLKTHLETNDRLLADWPEVCWPVRALEGEVLRCKGQRHHGERTLIEWRIDQIVFPRIPGSKAAGATLRVGGLQGKLRGAIHATPTGESIRPTLCIVDDPQTDASAKSPLQVHERLRTITGAILGLAGPGRRAATLIPCTVIQPDDLADQLLNPDKFPLFQGERTRMLYAEPANTKLWGEYADLLRVGTREGRGMQEATRFYRKHRRAMDVGAKVAWPARYDRQSEASAIQHAMNKKLTDEAAFQAEYQNNPKPRQQTTITTATADDITKHQHQAPRGVVPATAQRLTAFIDVQKEALFWLVAAWEDTFTGYVIDYGTFPDQGRRYFSLAGLPVKLGRLAKQAGHTSLEGTLYWGIDQVANQLLSREWPREDDQTQKIERCLIDANWGASTDIVYRAARESPHAALLLPSHGRYVGAASRPLNLYQRKPGDRVGLHWRIPAGRGRAIRHALYDTNWWKSFLQQRLQTPAGERGSLRLYRDKPGHHGLLADHLTAEIPYEMEHKTSGRTVTEWKLAPNRDNHWLDCAVGAAVAASIQGATLEELRHETQRRPKRRRSTRTAEALQ